MSQARSPRRLTAAVAVALAAACAGTLTTGGTAAATATIAVSSSTAQTAVAALLPESVVIGHGPTGFLTSHQVSPGARLDYRWTRYADGVSTLLPAGTYRAGLGSDVIVKTEGTTYTLYDMATGAVPTVIDTSSLGSTARLAALSGSTLVMRVPRATGGADIHLVGKPDGTLVDRVVTGLPAAAQNDFTAVYIATTPGTLLIRYRVDGETAARVARVDLTTAQAVGDQVLTGSDTNPTLTASATRLAWTEPYVHGSDSRALRVARHGEAESSRIPIGRSGQMTVGFLGDDWVTYADAEGMWSYDPNPLDALTATSLTDGRTVKLLDLAIRILPGRNGELLVHGATLEDGEGLYRITVGQDGEPVTTLVATTGSPLAYTVTSVNIPATVDLTTASGDPTLRWNATGISYGKVTIELTHTATSKRATIRTITRRSAAQSWNGLLDDRTAAPLGDYTWRFTTEPSNGIGPKTERTGTLKVIGKPGPHDFSNSSAPDLLQRVGGRLSVFDARQILAREFGRDPVSEVVVGNGWDAYDRIATPGNLGGSAHADLLARDKTGVLWSYEGTGNPSVPFKTRTKVGGGWNAYNQLTAGGDMSGDGRPDLLATDKTGVLWLYKGTGSTTAPFSKAVRIGGGWGVYNKITATGNIGGGPAGDLIARDGDGRIWLYLGKGDGTFTGRTWIESGWNWYDDIVAVGDANRDGHNDLLVSHRGEGTAGRLFLSPGTGNWHYPFSPLESLVTSPRLAQTDSRLF
ncbi:VCBS repeat-containing protein [Streptomyces stackebrandtii]|uniref:VCBS repeat-containing protein n=1 Tax=Streptomyces stackebrandtii TaxID=3051177 RepID=UPI0028DBEF49|nr:VCBS repeat-containing protein [Streptomyces sp. DSM 40976]